MRSAISLIRGSAVRTRAALFLLGGIAAAAVAWTRPPAAQLTTAQIQSLLPPSSVIRSVARVDLDGHAPPEAGVVASVPIYPGAQGTAYYGFVLGFNRWTRQAGRLYAQPLPGPLPLSVDAGMLLSGRDAVVFRALENDGRQAYQVVGLRQGAPSVLHEGRFDGRLLVQDPLLIEHGPSPRAIAWDGRRFGERSLPSSITAPKPEVSWRYVVRNGKLVARSLVVHLDARQPLRLVSGRGGLATIVIPDPRFDVMENGAYRARRPGVYTIRILVPFGADNKGYTLSVYVE